MTCKNVTILNGVAQLRVIMLFKLIYGSNASTLSLLQRHPAFLLTCLQAEVLLQRHSPFGGTKTSFRWSRHSPTASLFPGKSPNAQTFARSSNIWCHKELEVSELKSDPMSSRGLCSSEGLMNTWSLVSTLLIRGRIWGRIQRPWSSWSPCSPSQPSSGVLRF